MIRFLFPESKSGKFPSLQRHVKIPRHALRFYTMLFLVIVLAGSLFLLPAAILLFVFLAALLDYLAGGGPAATTTGSNADLRVVQDDTPTIHRALKTE